MKWKQNGTADNSRSGPEQNRFHVREEIESMTRTVTLLLIFISAGLAKADDKIEFNRDVRPILSNHCFTCHGHDSVTREADLRLDKEESAFGKLGSGKTAIVAGKIDQSELLRRVLTKDTALQMPPVEALKPLSSDQITVLKKWIEQGAEYQPHWAFVPPRRPKLPTVDNQEWSRNEIDRFVLARLEKEHLQPSAEASPETLLRRVFFDLTGLPPTLEDVKRFRTDGYEKTVDRLLASSHFGERMAVDWLDAARYADTNGYFGDTPREMWLWRDWVINAFNANMTFDQFTIEQIAGDLIPNATVQQQIATGFNRNHMSNNETGIIEEEYRVEYVIDRLDTTMTTWLGLTVGCAQCHDHKYDPITQREFYELFAFFNTVQERGLLIGNNAPPLISVPTQAQKTQLAKATESRTAADRAYEKLRLKTAERIVDWEQSALVTLKPSPTDAILLREPFDGTLIDDVKTTGTSPTFKRGVLDQAAVFDGTQNVTADLHQFRADGQWTIGFWLKPDGSLSGILSKIKSDDQRRGFEVLWSKGRLTAHLVNRWNLSAIEVSTKSETSANQWQHVVITYDGSQKASGLHIYIDGMPVPLEIMSDSLDGSIETSKPLMIGRRDTGLGLYGSLDELLIVQGIVSEESIASWAEGERIHGILLKPQDERDSVQKQILFDHFLDHHGSPETRQLRDRVQTLRNEERVARDAIPTTLVMAEQEQPRKTFVLVRGQYDEPSGEVKPGVPGSLSAWSENAPRNRLGLAYWLVSKENPLTARVAVNRFWKQCFGDGLVRSMNNFGTQGEIPTHPELLDSLASEFRDNGWDIKELLRMIVTSSSYRQSSQFQRVNGEIFDPENRLLSRGPNFRLPMEMIRDQALVASGLLVKTIGGPSVKPYQPPGLWREVSYDGEQRYVPDTGTGLWRRSIYTFIKRQAPPPALLLLDGPTREKCTINRAETNTPLQALLLLNDEIYLEAARRLAQNVLVEEDNDDRRIRLLWRKVLTREPTPNEHRILRGLLDRQRTRFESDPTAAKSVLSVGESEVHSHLNQRDLAAWAIVAHTVLNLDEAITRR